MIIIVDAEAEKQARNTNPGDATCPACGLTCSNGVRCESELTRTDTYVCSESHLFSVTWLAVAA